MADIREAVENIQNLARLFDSVQVLAKHVQDMSSVEQATAQAKGRYAQAMGQLDDAHAELQRAEKLIKDAHERAQQIVKDAEHACKLAAETTQREQARLVQEAQEKIKHEMTVGQANLDRMASKAVELQGRVDDARLELAELEGKITRVKAAAAALLA